MLAERTVMAKGRPKTSERDDITVKLDRRLVGMAKLVATHQGTTVAELLSRMLEPPVSQAYAQMVAELSPATSPATRRKSGA